MHEHVEEFNRPEYGISEGACGLRHAAADLRKATLEDPAPVLNTKLIRKAMEPIEQCQHALHHGSLGARCPAR